MDEFSVMKYFDRMDQALEDILQKQRPVDKTVILWWGLDGLTLDENGDLKWISRKRPASLYPGYSVFANALLNATFPVDFS